jgi:hypothetical protein
MFDTKTNNWEFVPVKSRVFLFKEIIFSAADSASIKQICRKSIEELIVKGEKICKEKNDSRLPIIKIQLTGKIKEGLRKENLDLSDVAEEYENKCMLELENALDSKGLSERIEMFRKMYEEKKSIKELGVDILKTKLGRKDIDVEYLFEKLSDDKKIDEFVKEVTSKNKTDSSS